MGGHLITSGLANCEPFGGPGSCQMSHDKKCNVDPEMDCRVSRAVYRAVCVHCTNNPDVCDTVYLGTTGCTLHKCTVEHMSQTDRLTNNPQSKHHWEKHPDLQPKFVTQIVSAGIKFNTDRFIRESLEIEKAKNDPNLNCINQKSEWGHSGLVRLTISHT